MTPKGGNDRFNADAASWDSNPTVHKASTLALQSILQHFPDLEKNAAKEEVDVLEIGCGTGLLSFLLSPYVKSLTAVEYVCIFCYLVPIPLGKKKPYKPTP
jgi:protein-L-isoaspartate O-methyltransferase